MRSNSKTHLGHTARKRFGQNFLHDMDIIHQIVAAINPKNGQFLLEITKGNEESSFHIFSSIISKTDYGKLFSDNFEYMKKFFYVFERLINIFSSFI